MPVDTDVHLSNYLLPDTDVVLLQKLPDTDNRNSADKNHSDIRFDIRRLFLS